MPHCEFSPLDPSSYSRPDEALVTNIVLSLNVDFNKRAFNGSVKLDITKVNPKAKEIILDVKDLNIVDVTDYFENQKLKYEISDPFADFGSKMTVELPENNKTSYTLLINYSTSPNASGLQWLKPEQTLGKKHPFVFSQFQSIHARSFLPCQDTPGVKTRYTAEVVAPSDLTVLMSALRNGATSLSNNKIQFNFVQNVPVPAYLIAIAIGALKSKQIGPRSHVWAEEDILDAAAYEFEDTEANLKTAEDICGPYVWSIYDLLVLPPSFPYGGMENPCLTFVTPTVIAGDKSLVSVLSHEITHSWSGNLVTNRNFEHFWLNEGFTVFIERKIIGRLLGKQEQDFDAQSGTAELKEEVNHLGANSPYTSLIIDLKGKDPDDAYSKVPYEKGQTFLRYLEFVVGGPEKFEPFLRDYFNTYKYKSIDTDIFKNHFMTYFSSNPEILKVDWQTWLHSPGMPPIIPEYDMTLVEACNDFVKKFLGWNGKTEDAPFTETEFNKYSTLQMIHILQEIMDSTPQSIEKLKATEKILKFADKRNTEIKCRWLRICLKAHWEEKIEDALNFVNEYGRMKYVRPVYRELYAWEASRQRAIDNFVKHQEFYMTVAVNGLRKDLHLQ
ncbi:leukotriene A-4 hydrolase [Agrilus planipennis]|uniref:Leukotriene A-4 hydrolase n=1 Tax=Agrilus planipennis TaxID=224129 RepID=A0A1W4WJA4_AGRPL|nr:leukotriene A-4 hydrolase [Agrilus planipennis]